MHTWTSTRQKIIWRQQNQWKNRCLASSNPSWGASSINLLRLPIAYCLLPIAYCLLPMAYCLWPIAYCLLPIAYCLSPVACCLLPVADCLMPNAYCMLPVTCYLLLPVACCMLPIVVRCLAALEWQRFCQWFLHRWHSQEVARLQRGLVKKNKSRYKQYAIHV